MTMRTWDKLSASFVKGVRQPGRHGDGGGLMLQATATKAKGVVTKAWLFRFELGGRERYMGLGSARVVSLAEARAKANEARKLLAAGIDPIAARDAEHMERRAAELRRATFRECLDGLLASKGDKWRIKHLAQWRNSMARYCKPIMDVAVGDVDVGMVLRVIEGEWKRAPVTMDRVRRRIGEVLGYAQARGLRPAGPLPTLWKNHLDQLLSAPRELAPVQHHAALAYAEAPALFARLVASDGIPDLCLALIMLTAVRSVEARGARWSEFDFAARTWTIPPTRMKKKREHTVPLSVEALALLKRLPRNGEYLFTVNGNGKPIVAMSLRKALARHAGAGLSVHGMRTCFRVWADERSNYPREIKEHALAHTVGNASERAYARSPLVERRRPLMAAWATFLATRTTGTKSPKVVPIRQERRHG